MKLRNKKTGEIVECAVIPIVDDYVNEYEVFKKGDSLAELNEEWQDHEEPKEYWCIDWTGGINHITVLDDVDNYEENKKEIGNYFETKEEAEKAVENLKAWKRLKDKGFRFERWCVGGEYGNTITFSDYIVYNDETRTDLDLLFGGEE